MTDHNRLSDQGVDLSVPDGTLIVFAESDLLLHQSQESKNQASIHRMSLSSLVKHTMSQ